jgi:hypothetical protein
MAIRTRTSTVSTATPETATNPADPTRVAN